MRKRIKQRSNGAVAVRTILAVLVILAAAAGVYIYSGVYDIGADDHHTRPVAGLLQVLRERSIEAHSGDIKVPALDDPQLILKGAGQYAAMCTDCHLAPGKADSEIRPGLYPQPPDLSRQHLDPRDEFWVIKHGIKMSAMPAWGFSHDDATIWSMVAFLQKLPGMTPAQYQDIVARAPPDDDMEMGAKTGHSDEHAAAADAAGPAVAGTQGMSLSAGAAPGQAAASSAAEAPLPPAELKPQAVPLAEAAAQAFQTALQKGDRAAALALLAPDATIREDGHAQTREAYAAGHLAADIALLKDAQITQVTQGSMSMGDIAVVGSERDITATVKGKPVTVRSRELLDLRQFGTDWKIVSIQRQSAPVAGQ
ncbi:MAG: c-type cytochrome [Xanthomonadaceae bacterium]|nr:c-type cytochrome [Xanthomonadaceae bacterium]